MNSHEWNVLPSPALCSPILSTKAATFHQESSFSLQALFYTLVRPRFSHMRDLSYWANNSNRGTSSHKLALLLSSFPPSSIAADNHLPRPLKSKCAREEGSKNMTAWVGWKKKWENVSLLSTSRSLYALSSSSLVSSSSLKWRRGGVPLSLLLSHSSSRREEEEDEEDAYYLVRNSLLA